MKQTTTTTNYSVFFFAFVSFIIYLLYKSIKSFLENITKNINLLTQKIENEIDEKSPEINQVLINMNLALEKIQNSRWVR